jgi:hypothetical protein
MKIELSDDTFCNIIVTELMDLHRHCDEEWYECEDVEELRKAVRLILKQYMIPSEYQEWMLDLLSEHDQRIMREEKDGVSQGC